jgi:hypothetical protein
MNYKFTSEIEEDLYKILFNSWVRDLTFDLKLLYLSLTYPLLEASF